MSTRILSRSVPLLCVVGVLFWLGPVADCQAQKKSKEEKAAEKAAKEQEKAAKHQLEVRKKAAQEQHKKAIEHARHVLKEEFKGKESEALKEAYVLMAAANHDYDGHRAKAMKQVELAFDRLDTNIMRHGTLAQRIKTLQEENIAARAKLVARNSAAIHEVQALSDAQMFKAAAMISVIAETAFFHKQPVVLGHLKEALLQLETALLIR